MSEEQQKQIRRNGVRRRRLLVLVPALNFVGETVSTQGSGKAKLRPLVVWQRANIVTVLAAGRS
jgi:hypothetical protein